MKYFVVSDIHDRFCLMRNALTAKGFDPAREDHRLILCGDAFYSGEEPGELYEHLLDLHGKEKLILIYGNHDVELLDNLRAGHFGRSGNRTCAELLVRHLTGKNGLSDAELIAECARLGFTDFLATVPVWYFETPHYVFTHGFIPTEKYAYRPDWRNATEKEWRTAAFRGDGMLLSMRYGVRVPGKTVVFGHYSAARCYRMKNAAPEDWEKKLYKKVSAVPPDGFRPYFGDTFIALDQSVAKTGFVNCIILDD
ncbi:MAG: metallophosphoesterase family protein [Clostridiales bacterium]|nr:metallophosphoesterase family protein [Candidatus Coliplasma caballi]